MYQTEDVDKENTLGPIITFFSPENRAAFFFLDDVGKYGTAGQAT